MATGFKTPEMNWDAADLRDELAKFKQYCDLIFSGPYSRKTEKEQASFILLWIGRQGLETYNSWTWDDAEDRNKPWATLKRGMTEWRNDGKWPQILKGGMTDRKSYFQDSLYIRTNDNRRTMITQRDNNKAWVSRLNILVSINVTDFFTTFIN